MKEPVRVALDMSPVAVGLTGVVRYGAELWKALGQRHDVALSGFAAGRGRRLADVRRLALPLRVLHPLWHYVRWPSAERIVGPIDVVHSLDLVPPPTRAPLVISLQDVLPATHPELYSGRARRAHRVKLRELDRASIIVTSTEAAAYEVTSVTGVDRDRIVVARPGGRPPVDPSVPSPVVQPFVLAVGALTPRKGFDVLAALALALGDEGPTIVIAGPDGYRAAEVRQLLAPHVDRGRVRLLGSVPDLALGALYRDALLVCHPSIAEGFGLVCLEAMQAGTPLVARRIPAVEEVVGRAGVLVDPGDTPAFVEAVLALLSNEGDRERQRAAGLQRARQFSWEAMAEDVVRAYALALTA